MNPSGQADESPKVIDSSDELSRNLDVVRYGIAFAGASVAVGLLMFGDLDPNNVTVTRTAAVAILMATLWITETVPLAATALIPLAIFPALGVQAAGEVAKQYINSTVVRVAGQAEYSRAYHQPDDGRFRWQWHS